MPLEIKTTEKKVMCYEVALKGRLDAETHGQLQQAGQQTDNARIQRAVCCAGGSLRASVRL